MGSKKRSFNPDWFKNYDWLEYSVERDAAFCFPCRHFSTGSGRAEDTFTREGLEIGSMQQAERVFSKAIRAALHTSRQ